MTPECFEAGTQIIKEGDISTFMAIVYQGEIGVYINLDYKDSSQFSILQKTTKPAAIKSKTDILGEQGLLKASKRGASCIALTDAKCLTISAKDYAYIIEGFHRVQLQKNISYISELPYFKFFSYKKIDQIAKWVISRHLSKGEVLLKEGSMLDQMYILRQGVLDVQKIIKIESSNYWPVKTREWEWYKTYKNFKKSVFSIKPWEFFGLSECLLKHPISSTIISQSDDTQVLCINRDMLTDTKDWNIFSADELKNLLKSKFWISIPEQGEMVKKAIVDWRAQDIRAKAMKEITNSVIKQYPKKELSIGRLKQNYEQDFPKSRTPSAMETRKMPPPKRMFSKFKR